MAVSVLTGTTVSLTGDEVAALVQAWFWPLVRVGGFVMAAPLLGTRAVPARIRMVLAVALTAVIAPILPPLPAYAALDPQWLLTTAQQVCIGVALGLAVRMAFLVLELSGQIIAMQMGLGFAAMVDPQNGTQVPVVGQFYVVVATLLFLAVDGHLALVDLLARSFTLLPVGTGGLDVARIGEISQWAGWLFAQAVVISSPAVVALLGVNVAFGIMTRAAPQLNVFAVGFPVTILVGVGIILLALPAFIEILTGTFTQAFALAEGLLSG